MENHVAELIRLFAVNNIKQIYGHCVNSDGKDNVTLIYTDNALVTHEIVIAHRILKG